MKHIILVITFLISNVVYATNSDTALTDTIYHSIDAEINALLARYDLSRTNYGLAIYSMQQER
jgi:hypothetical protein